MDGDAILGAVRGVVTGALGSVRTVPADTFGEIVHGDTEDVARWVRAKVKKQADVRMGPPRRTRAVGPSSGSRAVLDADFDVRLTYAADPTEDLIPARRYAVRALAAEDALTVTQALCWPGNLAEDEGANPTGLVGQKLRERAAAVVTREDWSAGIYEVELRLAGWILETQAVA